MRKTIFIIVFMVISSFCFGQEIVMSIGHLKVESEYDQFKNLGKGMLLLIESDLKKNSTIKMIERIEINNTIKEQEFSTIDLAARSTQIQLGKLLSAEYILTGTIFDLGKTVLVSLELIDTSTGETEWKAEVMDKIQHYDFISGYFARSLLNHFELNVTEKIIKKIETRKEKSADGIFALSDGINAYDEGDLDTAKSKLNTAKELDPDNDAANSYLAQRKTNTSQFKVMYDLFYAADNPAKLGVISNDSLNVLMSTNIDKLLLMFVSNENSYVEVKPDTKIRELDAKITLAYTAPITENLGIGIEAFWGVIRNDINVAGDKLLTARFGTGGIFSAGYKITNNISVGLSAALFSLMNYFPGISPYVSGEKNSEFTFSISPGILFVTDDESFSFDTRFGYCSGHYDVIDPEGPVPVIDDHAAFPLFMENTVTFLFNQKNTFFIINQTNELNINENYYIGRILPMLEHYFTEWISLRVGVEASFMYFNLEYMAGYGVLGGISLSVLDWGFDVNLNVSYCLRPSRILEEEMYPSTMVLFSFVWTDVFFGK